MGRLTKYMKTTRPDNVLPEIWPRISEKDKNKKIAEWAIEGPRRDEARAARNSIRYLSEEDEKIFKEELKAARAKHSIAPAPAMPLVSITEDTDTEEDSQKIKYGTSPRGEAAAAAKSFDGKSLGSPPRGGAKREHQDHIKDSALPNASEFFYACVHKPISMKEVGRIPDAKKALADEWKKLFDKPAWNLKECPGKSRCYRRSQKERRTSSLWFLNGVVPSEEL